MPALPILYEDNHLIVLNKPAGVGSAHFDGVHETLDHLTKEYIKARDAKPGNVFLGVVHRLDQPVSGVLVFAKTSKAAARLSESFRDRDTQKTYWAIVETAEPLVQTHFTWQDHLLRVEQQRWTKVVASPQAGTQEARTYVRVRDQRPGLAWLELSPVTGRKHQLRAQCQHRQLSIVGDGKYGSRRLFHGGIGLHAVSLVVKHPTRLETLRITASVPAEWLVPEYVFTGFSDAIAGVSTEGSQANSARPGEAGPGHIPRQSL